MFDQLVKRSNAVWIYSTGRFAEERRTFLCDLNERRDHRKPPLASEEPTVKDSLIVATSSFRSPHLVR
jgi:hypothetical protein